MVVAGFLGNVMKTETEKHYTGNGANCTRSDVSVRTNRAKQRLRLACTKFMTTMVDSRGFTMRDNTRYKASTSTQALAQNLFNPNRHRSIFLRKRFESLQRTYENNNGASNKTADGIRNVRDGDLVIDYRSISLDKGNGVHTAQVCPRSLVDLASKRFRTKAESFIWLSRTVCVAAGIYVTKPLINTGRSSWERRRNYFSGILHEMHHSSLFSDHGKTSYLPSTTRSKKKITVAKSSFGELSEFQSKISSMKEAARYFHKLSKEIFWTHTLVGVLHIAKHIPYSLIFKGLAVNGDRKLLHEEIVLVVLRCFHLKTCFADEEVDFIFEVIDIDGSNIATLAEFAMLTLACLRSTRNPDHTEFSDSGPKNFITTSRASIIHQTVICPTEDEVCLRAKSEYIRGQKDGLSDSSLKTHSGAHLQYMFPMEKRLFTSNLAVTAIPLTLPTLLYKAEAIKNLQLRLEMLWDEMLIPQRDRDYFTVAFCGSTYHKFIIARHIEDLLHHRRRIKYVLEAIKYRHVGVTALCHAVCPLTIAPTSPKLEALATATQDVLGTVEKWYKDLWTHLPFHYKDTNCVYEMADDITNIIISVRNKTGVGTPVFKEGGYTLQDNGGILGIIAYLIGDLDFHTLTILLPRHTYPPHGHIATIILNEAVEVAAMRQTNGLCLAKGIFAPRLIWLKGNFSFAY